ncbi:hypothetical protein OJF2_52860 [Aquisphaera giovannonii]|uniref:Uncharacterized protein n=1 Tax=Aquisphaera giovannonii TaxID=406548 RepID=A0A5B9W9F0_9BACT|nr:hypothetical protein [Aquisphaera giovannonii]QEH36701.1 hypothetical protein OJF2_52860 [Aquisphaera giovannonii]
MRRRAFRPELPGQLEDRSLASVAAGSPGHPAVFRKGMVNDIIREVHSQFLVYIRYRDPTLLREQIDRNVTLIPYSRADRLLDSIDGILHDMLRDQAAGAPRPVLKASNRTIALIRSDVVQHVKAGDLVLTLY